MTQEEYIAYEQGYKDGAERWREHCERLSLQLQDCQKRYDCLLKLRTEELLLQPPGPIIISKDSI